MYAMIARRIGLSLILLLAVSMLIFLGLDLLPGDFAATYLGQSATPQAIANIRAELGLDAPAVTRYLDWLTAALRGDFGTSWASRTSINDQIASRMGNTMFLAAVAAVIAVPLSVGCGVISVLYHDRWPDKAISIVSLAAISLPEFFTGYLLILLFSVKMQAAVFPSTVFEGMSLADKLAAVALPAATLVFGIFAHMMRMTRAALLQVMTSPYMETADLKGLPKLVTIWKHAMPNALAPVINVVAMSLAYLIVGVVVVEVVFVYPGMGQYMVDAVTVRDMPVVQACGLIFAAIFIVLNLAADILGIVTNPKLRHPR